MFGVIEFLIGAGLVLATPEPFRSVGYVLGLVGALEVIGNAIAKARRA